MRAEGSQDVRLPNPHGARPGCSIIINCAKGQGSSLAAKVCCAKRA